MKFCSHCGKEIVDAAIVCPNCGCSVASAPSGVVDEPSAGLNILAFLLPIIGLAMYLIYQEKTPIRAKAIGKWALIGFIVGCSLIALRTILIGLFITFS